MSARYFSKMRQGVVLKMFGSQVVSPAAEEEEEEERGGGREDGERRGERLESTAEATAQKALSRLRAGVTMDEGPRNSHLRTSAHARHVLVFVVSRFSAGNCVDKN